MKRIVFNGRFLAQPTTGVQRYGRETLAALDRLLAREPALRRGARWQLALPHDADDPPLVDHFEIETLQFLRGHAWEQLALARFARGAYLINPGYSGPVAKTRQMITVHDAGIAAHPQTYRAGYRWFGRAMMAALGPRVDTVVTMSHFSAGELRTHFGLTRDDVLVGRSGWEHVRDAPAVEDAAVLRRHGLHSGGYLLAVGSLKANKNFAVVPRALQKLGPGLRLPLAVVGARDASVYQGVEPPATGLSKLLGFVPDEELYALYRHAAWFVFPSVYEGFGLPPLEALANGCPVLASNAASIPEVYGDAVLYFDPHDPASLAARLQEVLNHPDPGLLRRTLQRRARARLDLYRWDANARILADRLIAVGALEPAHQAGPAHATQLHAAHH
jgi:glycosyltransferase involved in cell wall biosynthesis